MLPAHLSTWEEEKKKLLKFTFSTSRWKHLFLQCRSAFWSYWDGVKAGLVHQCWRCCSRILKGNLHSLSCNITFFPPSDFYISQQYWLLCIVGAVHVAPQYGIDSSSKNELKREVFIYERNPAGVFVYIHKNKLISSSTVKFRWWCASLTFQWVLIRMRFLCYYTSAKGCGQQMNVSNLHSACFFSFSCVSKK